MNNYTSLRVHSTESVVFAGAGTKTLAGPTSPIRGTYLMQVSNTADPTSSTSIAYLVPKGSTDTVSALLVRPGESAQFGPVGVSNLDSSVPDLYCSGAATIVVTWVFVQSER